ncbi:MAG: hypothetical protein KatS3mg110_4179 [Pirellulaceae bacterium]|nr:MAG: hypothetical protein KatS3mg110_4179 [Pirellulaceae bacterium]
MTSPAAVVESSWWNVPNQITLGRLLLSLIIFLTLELQWYWVAAVLFVLAAGTDWVDGYWARRYGQVTRLGRILDPFVDKFLICGVFIYLAAIPEARVYGWVAVIITARELLVTALRGEIEGRGGDFSARWSGKWKMALQCVAAGMVLGGLAVWGEDAPAGWRWAVTAGVTLAVLITIHSGYDYVVAAMRLLRQPQA